MRNSCPLYIVGETAKELSAPSLIYFIISSTVTTSMYILLAVMIRNQFRKTSPLQNVPMKVVSVSGNVHNEDCEMSTEQAIVQENTRQIKYSNTQKKLNKMMSAIFIVYYLCYFMILFPPHIKAIQSTNARLVQNLIYSINLVSNPLIYLWLNNHFRVALKSVIGLKDTENELSVHTVTASDSHK